MPSRVKKRRSLQRAHMLTDVRAPDFPTECATVLNVFGISNEMSSKNENLQSEIQNIMIRCWLNKKSPANFFSYRRRQKS